MSGLFCKMQGYSINNSKDSCFFPLHVCKLCTKAKQIQKYIEQGTISQFNESFTYLIGCVNIIYGQTLYILSMDITMLVGILTTFQLFLVILLIMVHWSVTIHTLELSKQTIRNESILYLNKNPRRHESFTKHPCHQFLNLLHHNTNWADSFFLINKWPNSNQNFSYQFTENEQYFKKFG